MAKYRAKKVRHDSKIVMSISRVAVEAYVHAIPHESGHAGHRDGHAPPVVLQRGGHHGGIVGDEAEDEFRTECIGHGEQCCHSGSPTENVAYAAV